MCAKVIYVLLAGLFVYVTATIAAFAYLEWWQAILASMLTFVLMIALSKAFLKRFVRSMGRRAGEFLNKRSIVLKGATLEVHSVKPTTMPREVVEHVAALAAHVESDEDDAEPDETPEDLSALRWHLIEATLFPVAVEKPKRRGSADDVWDPLGLRIVPMEAKKIEFLKFDSKDVPTPEFDLWELAFMEDGEVKPLEDVTEPIIGPRRLRFAVGTPSEYRLLKLQYFTEQFGRIELPVQFSPRSRS